MFNSCFKSISFFLLTLCLAAHPCDSLAQIRFDVAPRPQAIEVDAVAGLPFGVGRIVFELPREMLPQPLGLEGVGLSEKNNRAVYPAIDNAAFGKVMREILGADTPLTSGGPVREEIGGILRGIFDRPSRTTLYFLFQGDKPLDLTLEARSPLRLSTIVPRNDPAAHRQMLQSWWKQYAKPNSLLQPKPDYPPIVDNYLLSTLARRLNLRLPDEKQTDSPYVQLRKELGLNLGTESLRMAMQQDRILGLNNWQEPADQALPEAPILPELELPEPAADVKIEPMAMRVPAECFYVRFGSFANFLWLQDTLAKWGGDMQNLIALRSLDHDMSGRMENQLVLKQTLLSRMLGGAVIADVAIIGTDMFFREGASYGMLFQARNNLALSTSLNQQRQERLKAGGVAEEKIDIRGQEVSYLSSPDGRVRSYYVADGDYHFVATSKTLVERFLSTASGKNSLGAAKDFRHARELMPLSRGDTVWLYLSDAFFHNITSPRYRVEMARRLQAAADIDLVRLAVLAAACEGRPGETIEQLQAASLLPPEFGPLPDGSRIEMKGEEVFDTVRGHRGAFLPTADTPVDKITRAELAEYQRFVDAYRANWGRMDPVTAAVKRTGLKDNREQVVIDVLMSPFAPQHFDLLRQQLGPADDRRLARVAGDMASIDLALTDQRVFGGLRDVGRPPTMGLASWLPAGRLRDFVVGYVGTTGELGVLRFLNIGIPPQSDAAGYAVSPLGGFRRVYGEFILFSFQPEVLEAVAPQLRFEPAPRPAQVRLWVDDVSRATATPALNDLLYARTRQTSQNNVRFLHGLNQQLHVAPAACKDTAELLLDAKLVCPLGGEYVLREDRAGGPKTWTSTALQPEEPGGLLATKAPPGFVAPPLSWFRGLDLDATMTEKTISAHAEVLMETPAKP